MRIIPCLLFAALLGCAGRSPRRLDTQNDSIRCEIGIVGGGPAGVYLSYRLAPRYGDGVCLFEKEATLGGRIRDEELDASPRPVHVGTGARRVNVTQDFVRALGRELGIEFQTPEPRAQLIQHQGRFGYSSEAFVDLYPGLIKPDARFAGDTREDKIYAMLLADENASTAARYPSLRAYISTVAGPDAVPFLRASSRFHGDFDYDVSAPNYLSMLRHESALSSVNLYPVGGMSAFIRGMESAARARGARFFTAEPVLEIERDARGTDYVLRTPLHRAAVAKLVLAVPPAGLDHVGGAIPAALRAAPEYRALLPIKVVVINQTWDRRWWENVRNPAAQGDAAKTWRAWSTDQCVTHVEIPQEPYLAAANVTRSVYTDDPKCVDYWRTLKDKEGIDAVGREASRGLSTLFNHGLDNVHVEVPRPLRTTMRFWPGGWYYVRAGSAVSNKRISEWALHPLTDQENLSLIGEAYWPDRPGWSEGAYFSANALLDARFKDVPHPR